jgi:hypothetical protein
VALNSAWVRETGEISESPIRVLGTPTFAKAFSANEQQGVAYAKTVAEAMDLKLDADNPADREKLRRAVLDLVAGRKTPKQKGASLSR